MTFKHVLLGTAAAGSLLVAVAAVASAGFSLIPKAEAATNISVNINIGRFYDGLAPYGDWVWYHGRYVWIPEDVDDHWRPYTEGHWVFTRRYGWMWISDERFGWACYRYGRWGFGRDIGWYWVPGRIWGPAWVAFSHDEDDFAWAPLPPDRYDDVNIVISFGDIPDYYWQAAPFSAFLSIDLSDHVYRDRDRVRRVIRNREPKTVHIENNIVVNNVIEVGEVEKKTKKKVAVLEEKVVDNPDAAGKADSNSVAIFNPEVKEEPDAKPKKAKKVEEVVKERKAKGIPELEQPTDQAATTSEEPVTKKKKKATVSTEEQAAPVEKKKKKAAVSTEEQMPADEEVAPVQKKKKKAAVSTEEQMPADEEVAPVQKKKKKAAVSTEEQVAPVEKKKKKAQAATEEQMPSEEQMAPVEKKKGGKKGKAECDPASQDCPPAE